MTTATIKVDCALSNEHFEDIMDTAGLIIGYWAESASIEFIDEDSEELIYRVKELECTEYVLTKSDIETSLRDAIEGNAIVDPDIRDQFIAFCFDKDQGDLDGFAADALIQLACFQEVIYG